MTNPSADPSGVWIICRHRLPFYGDRVLVAYKSVNSNWCGVQVAKRSHTDKHGEHWKNDSEETMSDNVRVYAWMPLPENCFEE
jgi:hypothetical protein